MSFPAGGFRSTRQSLTWPPGVEGRDLFCSNGFQACRHRGRSPCSSLPRVVAHTAKGLLFGFSKSVELPGSVNVAGVAAYVPLPE